MTTTSPLLATRHRSQGRHDHDVTDEALISRSAEGDGSAFDTLISRYRPDMVAFCQRYFHDQHDRDDLLQESMIKAWRRIGQFDNRSSVRTWLYRIVANAAIDEYRRQARAATPFDPQTDRSGSDVSPEQAIVDRAHLNWAITGLPAPYRTVSVLADKLGYPYAEIAQLCGIPEATVRSRLWRARRALRAALGATEPA
ncbi:RNA polymerase sigma factor [Solwaraspora sp. WMMD791]|uniref:RNA polymerase sigma factor n=1 Tax=Solwaraspora sp. WMMD791 TaxID=3016086 RepID=UPI00249C3E75|nr:RNA polymerase sigma factor [Solwaraspora sp. WMMD791]WFE29287.1 RNA polymerase sigma factor [Solwaraspora sp. WMMD791]